MNRLATGPASAFRSAPVSDVLCAVPGCAIAHWSMGRDVLDAGPCPHGWSPAAQADTPTLTPIPTRTGGPTAPAPIHGDR
ncbi:MULTISPECIES: hypothetical protein [unclassified Streptomyces]|uniref:hypothetical protein n=1 Tax=unclassified Streptomyces TaxID=2593676 RepID=UPI0036650F30